MASVASAGPAATAATSPKMTSWATAAVGAQPMLSPGMHRRLAFGCVPRLPAAEQAAMVCPVGSVIVGLPGAPRSVTKPVSVHGLAVPRALVTVRLRRLPRDAWELPLRVIGSISTSPASLARVIVVPITGCTTISVREQGAAVASQLLARIVIATWPVLLTSPPESSTVKSSTTGAPGSVAGAS